MSTFDFQQRMDSRPIRGVVLDGLAVWLVMTLAAGAFFPGEGYQIGLAVGAFLALGNFLLQAVALKEMMSERKIRRNLAAVSYPVRYLLVGAVAWIVLKNAEGWSVNLVAFLIGLGVVYVAITLFGVRSYVAQRVWMRSEDSVRLASIK